MAMVYCPECGKSISDKAYVCPNCGMPLKDNNAYNPVKRKIPGRGFGIAGMIMGILGVVYGPLLFISAIAAYSAHAFTSTGNASEAFTGMGIEIAIFGILALIFGFVSRHKGYRKGKSLSAVVMGFITLAFCAAVIVLEFLSK